MRPIDERYVSNTTSSKCELPNFRPLRDYEAPPETGRPFSITDGPSWLERRGGTLNDFVFPSRNDYMAHMSTRQYARLVHEWVVGIGLPAQDYGTHSLRRTKASIIYKATGNLRAVQILLGHAKIDSTVRYLGVDVEDALELAERTEV